MNDTDSSSRVGSSDQSGRYYLAGKDTYGLAGETLSSGRLRRRRLVQGRHGNPIFNNDAEFHTQRIQRREEYTEDYCELNGLKRKHDVTKTNLDVLQVRVKRSMRPISTDCSCIARTPSPE